MDIRRCRASRRHALHRKRIKAFRIALEFYYPDETTRFRQAYDWARRHANHLLRCGCYLCTEYKRDYPSIADIKMRSRLDGELAAEMESA